MKKLAVLLLTFCWHYSINAQIETPANIYTPNNSLVPDTYILSGLTIPTLSEEQIATIESQLDTYYDGAELLGTYDYRYNCHAYAWHLSENPNATLVWIGRNTITAEDVYWTDSSYIEVPEPIATKVSYHENGNHSAVRESSNWYISKWGNSLLVRHHPNAVPNGVWNPLTGYTNYCPNMTKKYYVRKPYTSFLGPSFAQPSATYEIENLDSNYTVEWNLSDSFYNQYCIQKNYPTANKCVITADSIQDMINATLTATIKKNGYTIKTLTKNVSSYVGFKGTYSQIPEKHNKYHFPTITNATIYDYEININPACDIIINSKNFLHKTVNSSNSSIILNTQTESVNFYVPYNSGISHFSIITSGSEGGENFSILVNVSSIPILSLNIEYYNNEILLSLINDEELTKTADLTAVKKNAVWNVEIINSITGRIIYSSEQFDSQLRINTSEWSPGVYIVQATIGNEHVTKKIYIRDR